MRINGMDGAWRGGGEAVGAGAAFVHPEWAGLKMRFQAIHALRRALAVATQTSLPAGSFLAAGAAVLASCRADAAGVNLVYSANGKGRSGIDGRGAVSPTRGDRGIL